ncbi:hypothetical protein JOE21_003581 [Desmospora profundinema]|uniref:Uncharacterized protein n=1 Tax=Desmospora profundinema TaxID=1571184 RepID=A0ABU1IS47_9BACL|nr:hypothetical protein [Desmospora profundinema]
MQKKEGKKTDKHSTYTKDQLKDGKLPTKSRKYSSHDLLNSKGKVKQRRYYDGKGRADMDIDYTDHGNPKQHPKVPHRHDWTWKDGKATRSKGY